MFMGSGGWIWKSEVAEKNFRIFLIKKQKRSCRCRSKVFKYGCDGERHFHLIQLKKFKRVKNGTPQSC